MSTTPPYHYYSLKELDEVLGGLPDDRSMRRVISNAKGRAGNVTAESIRAVAKELGLTHAGEAVINSLEGNRLKRASKLIEAATIANDDDVLTVGQLRKAITEVVRGYSGGRWITEGNADDFVDQIMERVNHPWKGGDVVRDATGAMFRKRHVDDKWDAFGSASHYDYNFPKRPLTKVE